MKKILIIIFLIQCFCCFANKTKLYHGNMIFQCVKISDDSIEFIDFDLKETNQIDRIVDVELSYCKNCGIYYAEPVWYKKLLKEYGKNKLNFVDEETKQMRLRL